MEELMEICLLWAYVADKATNYLGPQQYQKLAEDFYMGDSRLKYETEGA